MSKLFISDQAAFGLTEDIANTFCESGFSVTIIAGTSLPRANDKINQIKITRYDKSSTLKRIFTWLKGAWELFKIFRKNPDAELFIISNPPVAPLLPLFLKNKFSLLLWDIWPDALVHTGTLSENNFIVRFWAWLNKKSFKKAEKVFTISNGLADALTRYVSRERICVVPLWADTSLLKPFPRENNPFLREHKLENKFVVMYSGNIGNTHPVEKIVDIANTLKSHSDIAFVIIGDGGKRAVVEQRIRETGAQNVLLLPFQSRETFPHALAAANVSVITLEEAASQVSVPSKTYSSLAIGSPLLCLAGKNSELANLIREHNVGEIFVPAETDAAAQWILSLKNDSKKQRELSQNALRAAQLFTPANAKKFIRSRNE